MLINAKSPGWNPVALLIISLATILYFLHENNPVPNRHCLTTSLPLALIGLAMLLRGNGWVYRIAIANMMIGALLNGLAVILNGGQMPVFGYRNEIIDGSRWKPGDADTILPCLCDVYGTPDIRWSIGDVFLTISLSMLLLNLVIHFLRIINALPRKGSL